MGKSIGRGAEMKKRRKKKRKASEIFRGTLDEFIDRLAFINWLAKLNYEYREEYRQFCKRKRAKPDWGHGYYEYLLKRR